PAVGASGPVRQREEREIVLGDRTDPGGWDDVVREGLPPNASAFGDSSERVVDLIVGADGEQLGEVAIALGGSRNRRLYRRGESVAHAFVSEKEEQLVAAIEELGDDHRSPRVDAPLIEAGQALRQAGAVVEELIGGQARNLVEIVSPAAERI